VAVHHRKHGNDWNCEKDARYARQFGAAKNGQDNRQRVHVNAAADEARIDHIVLSEAQDAEEQEDDSRLTG
jgi:hypothetical protein